MKNRKEKTVLAAENHPDFSEEDFANNKIYIVKYL
jgi:hypothetical protein